MRITIEKLPDYRLAYVQQVGPYGPANAQAMEMLKKWADENDLLTESATLLGIPQDNPRTTPPESCRYDACLVISADCRVEDSINEGKLSGGEYAVCVLDHTAEAMQQAWHELIPCLQDKGYQIENKPILERYTGRMILDGLCELCVPIKPL